MAAPKPSAVQIPVVLTLSASSFKFLEDNSPEGKVAEQLASWVRTWMDQQSRGGLMLDSSDHDAIAEANGGRRFKDSRSLCRAVLKGVNRDDSMYSFRVGIDPTFYPLFQDHARNTGLTEEECIDGIVQYILSTGMIYNWVPADGRCIPFSFDMLQQCAALCEKNKIDSTDIAGLIAEERLMPVSREMRGKMKALKPDQTGFTATDLDGLLDELTKARDELAELRTAPREMVGA